ncbi:MAG: twin-arginine translocase subunit TatC [Verrucomicrobia bacterium]|nr:twin-arginine translocase subunit TatC [Verrucomicrobiota bacterium]MCF7708976.1 twin-arginine translocase subunit TatC [Verrucomicrobiota bacterium]
MVNKPDAPHQRDDDRGDNNRNSPDTGADHQVGTNGTSPSEERKTETDPGHSGAAHSGETESSDAGDPKDHAVPQEEEKAETVDHEFSREHEGEEFRDPDEYAAYGYDGSAPTEEYRDEPEEEYTGEYGYGYRPDATDDNTTGSTGSGGSGDGAQSNESEPGSEPTSALTRTVSEFKYEDSEDEEDEDEGGPIKPFLDHLEDFRWTIIKCVSAVVIAMVVCLAAGNKLVELLTYPLAQAQKQLDRKYAEQNLVHITWGTNLITSFKPESDNFGPLPIDTNRNTILQVIPVTIGTNQVLALQSLTDTNQTSTIQTPGDKKIALKNYSPVGPFMVAIQIAIFGGIGLASPFLFLFIGQFIMPALKKKERIYVYRAVGIGLILFILGVVFCYFILVKIALAAAVKFAGWLNFFADEWRAEEYIGFVCKFMLGMGLSFELPVVILTLVKIGILDHAQLRKLRPYWVIINLVLSSLLTPPDIISQVLMAVPLQILFEISLWIAWYWEKKDRERLEAEGLA